jgi:methionyl-tRNA formyltransferase
MNKSRVVFLGSRDLGYQTLKWLIQDNRFDVVGVCLYPKNGERFWRDDPRELAQKFSIPEKTEKDLERIDFDLGVSVNYHRIINENTLKLARRGFWNIHHSYNLRLRGRNITTHAILRSKEDNIYYHGTTLHKMVATLDSGPIVASQATPVYPNDTAFSLFLRVNEIAYTLFKEWIPRIAFQEVHSYCPPNSGVLMFKAADLPSREVLPSLTEEELYDKVRAFDYPGQEPAYINKDGKKQDLVIYRRDKYQIEINLGNRIYYTS